MNKSENKYRYKDIFAMTIAIYRILLPRILTIILGLFGAMLLLKLFL